jgi:hypothetical protein
MLIEWVHLLKKIKSVHIFRSLVKWIFVFCRCLHWHVLINTHTSVITINHINLLIRMSKKLFICKSLYNCKSCSSQKLPSMHLVFFPALFYFTFCVEMCTTCFNSSEKINPWTFNILVLMHGYFFFSINVIRQFNANKCYFTRLRQETE